MYIYYSSIRLTLHWGLISDDNYKDLLKLNCFRCMVVFCVAQDRRTPDRRPSKRPASRGLHHCRQDRPERAAARWQSAQRHVAHRAPAGCRQPGVLARRQVHFLGGRRRLHRAHVGHQPTVSCSMFCHYVCSQL